MAGSVEGGKKAAAKNMANDPEFYSKIGKMGAVSYNSKPKHKRKPRGFAANPELARTAGTKGGTISRRGRKNEN